MQINKVSILNLTISKTYRTHQTDNYTKNQLPSGKFILPKDTVSFSGKLSPKPLARLFDNYRPDKMIKDGAQFNIHNHQIFARMKNSYSAKEFKKLFDYADQKGVFSLNINKKSHYITTSLITPKENPLMGKLVWVTDSARYMPILKDKYPLAAVPLMENMSKFYKKQERNFNKIINDPIQYEFNHDWPNTAKNGIGHVFNPETMITHKWFAHTRLDSPGLYLQTMCDLIKDGFSGAKYGYKKASDISQNSIDAISNTTAYLKAIDYPYAKDTGAWEEKTFNITPSSDVAIINEAFRKIIDLMYSKTNNPEILKVRRRILDTKHGKVFADEAGLREMLKIGEYRIKTNSFEEVPGERNLDGALSFVPHSEKFSDDVIEDARIIISRMQALESDFANTGQSYYRDYPKLVRENGTLRYLNDRYLNMTSGHEINRYVLNKNTEAQWFMTSDISKSYGIAAKRLLDKIEKDGCAKQDSETLKLLHTAIDKQTEFINRAYGRITGENTFKANGKPCPAFQVPEAYQAVKNSDGEIIFVPGTHTPLGWAQASLYDASKLLLENLTRIEKLSI